MPSRERRVDRGIRIARQILVGIGIEFRNARLAGGLSQEFVGTAAGISKSQVSRIERALSPAVSIQTLSKIASVLGLDLSVRTFSASGPLRDQAQLELIARFRGRLHTSFRVRSEVPMRLPGDPRAWDLILDGRGKPTGVEAETRLRDCQSIQRRINGKLRDSEPDQAILLLADTRSNRIALRDADRSLREMFPVPARAALRALGEGNDPGGSAIILL